MTARFYAMVDERMAERRKGAPPAKPLPEPVPLETTLGRLEEHFVRPSLDTRYRGAFMGRSVAAYDKLWREMIGKRSEGATREEVLAVLDAGYPESLRERLSALRDRREEEALLEGLERGVLAAPGGVIRYQGEEIPRRKLDQVIFNVKQQRREIEEDLRMHDRLQRAAHLDAARLLGNGWEAYLESLIALLHCTTHGFRNAADAHGSLHHTLRIVLADGSLSAAERERLISVGMDLQRTLAELWRTKEALVLPPAVEARFVDRGGYEVLNQKLGLNPPSSQFLGEWMDIVDGWAGGAVGDMKVLSEAVLDTLLTVEESIAKQLREGIEPGEAPAPAKTPNTYTACTIGSERDRQKTLGWWDRFQVADGFIPGAARLVVATGLLLPALFIGSHVGGSTLHVHNGLPVAVRVDVGSQHIDVSAHGSATLSISTHGMQHVEAHTLAGDLVESFDAPLGSGFSHALYNVAQASALTQWTATYGNATAGPARPLGAPRWTDAHADVYFQSPPHSSEHRTRSVISALDALPSGEAVSPSQQLQNIASEPEQRAFLRAHLRYERPSSRDVMQWFALGESESEVIAERIANEPNDIFFRRLAQDRAQGAEHDAICARDREAQAQAPDDPDQLYLALRCQPEGPAQDDAFHDAYAAHPDHPWLAWVEQNHLERQGDWVRAMEVSQVAYRLLLPLQPQIEIMQARYARRLQAEGQSVPIPSVTSGTALEFLTLSFSDTSSPDLRPYFALREGDLEGAREAALALPSDPDLAVLIGASEHASGAMIGDALLHSPDALHSTHAFAYALALREGGNASRYLPALEALSPRIESVFASLTSSPQALDELVQGHSAEQRATLYAMGVILLRDEAPEAWRIEANALLFSPERPYFAPHPQDSAP